MSYGITVQPHRVPSLGILVPTGHLEGLGSRAGGLP